MPRSVTDHLAIALDDNQPAHTRRHHWTQAVRKVRRCGDRTRLRDMLRHAPCFDEAPEESNGTEQTARPTRTSRPPATDGETD